MKIKIAYYPGEKLQALVAAEALKRVLPRHTVRTYQKHPPVTHIYIATPKPKND